MSPLARRIYNRAVKGHELIFATPNSGIFDCSEWVGVQLKTIIPAGMTSSTFGGLLSQLKRLGLYKPGESRAVGWFKLEGES